MINLNDSHKFYKGDIVLINKPWALNDINKIKKRAILIVDKNIDYHKKLPNLFRVNFSKYKIYKNSNQKIEKFFKNKICFYDPLFLTSIKLSYLIAKSIKKKLEIDMIGFDFKFKSPLNYTTSFLSDNDYDDNFNPENAKIEFKEQKKIFKKISLFKNKYININHIGNLEFSKLNILKFVEKNSLLSTHNNKTEIVAEITTNHHGNFENLLKMIKLSKEAVSKII